MKILNVLFLAFILTLTGCATTQTADTADKADTQTARQDVLYTCDCGPQCKCNSMSTTPGNCECGKPMKWGHVLRVEGNEAILCQCAKGCSCAGLDPKDPTRCMCGTPVKRVNMEGSGIYFCNCGGSCACKTVSDAPGPCKCGMKLKKVE